MRLTAPEAGFRSFEHRISFCLAIARARSVSNGHRHLGQRVERLEAISCGGVAVGEKLDSVTRVRKGTGFFASAPPRMGYRGGGELDDRFLIHFVLRRL
jgi:hypothetical protein